MYELNEILYGIRHPGFIVREINRIATRESEAGVDVFEEDWDNLVVLDACRYDYFHRHCDIDGTLSKRISKGSATKEWVEANFDKRLHDTVYVTANAWFLSLGFADNLYAYTSLHREECRNEVGTVPPELVTEAAIEAAEEYTDKRLVIHYVQPHAPYIGPTGRKYFGNVRGMNMHDMIREINGDKQEKIRKLRAAYEENLKIVLEEMDDLLGGIEGKTVITADHGEILGERYLTLPLREFGHPVGIRVPELVEVPWFECETESRRRIVPEEPEGRQSEPMEEVESLLRDLGYK